MRRHLSAVLLSVLPALSGAALAQDDVLTAAGSGGERRLEAGLVAPAAVCWYNGDIDYRNGFTSERNTMVHESWTYDDVKWNGAKVTGAFGHFLVNPGTPIVGGDVIVYRGMREGVFGQLVREIHDIRDFRLIPTGNRAFGRDEFRFELTLGESSFNLAPGDYHVGVRCVGAGTGQAFVAVTSGKSAQGLPPGNNGRTFLLSYYFGYPSPTDWQNLVGPGTWDVSFGLECGPTGYTVAVSGACPGIVRLEWTAAEPGRRQAIVVAPTRGSHTIPSGPCLGTQLDLYPFNVRVYDIIGTGIGSGAVSALTSAGVCRHHVQLITFPSCATSDVAQVP